MQVYYQILTVDLSVKPVYFKIGLATLYNLQKYNRLWHHRP